MVSSTQVCSVPLSFKFTVLDIGLIVFQYLDSFFLDQ
jgi:hypothetical protein